jgi:hypothetical protein
MSPKKYKHLKQVSPSQRPIFKPSNYISLTGVSDASIIDRHDRHAWILTKGKKELMTDTEMMITEAGVAIRFKCHQLTANYMD